MKKNDNEKQRLHHGNLNDILPDLLGKEPVIGNKRFNSTDGKVLRFCAILDENDDQQHEILRKFIILVTKYISV